MRINYIYEGNRYTNVYDLRKVFANISLPQNLTAEVLGRLGVDILELEDEIVEPTVRVPSVMERIAAVEDAVIALMLGGGENV